MKEVENKWSTLKLNDDIWAKLIYFERNRRLAKAYVSAPVLTIDGSTSGLDGFRIGLSGIDNTYRCLQSVGCLRSIGQGIKLKIDSQGNILIKKIGDRNAPDQNQCSIWVKSWPNGSSNNFSQAASSRVFESTPMKEIDHSDTSYKLFDMRKFRLMLEKSKLRGDGFLNWRHCVSIISFVQNVDTSSTLPQAEILDDPCWIMLINIIAIDMLKSSIRSEKLPARCTSSSLIQNHSLLESRKVSSAARTSSRLIAVHEPLHMSSSASNLYPGTSGAALSLSNQRRSEVSATCTENGYQQHLDEPTRGLSQSNSSSSDRVKKLRTTAGRYRSSTNKSSSSNYRRYQSSQHLDATANNAIYTTFNSKYVNPKRYSKLSDMAGYDYGSRASSSSKSQWQILPHQSGHSSRTSRYQQPSVHKNQETRWSEASDFSRLDFSAPNYRSLSVVDLSQRQARFSRPIDLRNIKSSIKMNYDNYPSEEEDDAEQEFQRQDEKEEAASEKENIFVEKVRAGAIQQTPTRPSTDQNPKLFLNSPAPVLLNKARQQVSSSTLSACRCELIVAHQLSQNSSGSDVNHHECDAVHGHQIFSGSVGSSIMKQGDEGKKQQFSNLDGEGQQKVSRSSIASSSSSSGCADNDYFMSQSSSSMSSSTTSNEPEQFSQPASSSGIACSNVSTSDEYDDKVEPTVEPETQLRKSTKNKDEAKNRECILKSIPRDHICCLNGSTSSRLASEENLDCDCLAAPNYECNCCSCACACMKKPHTFELKDTEECNCIDESIYDVLPAINKLNSRLDFDLIESQVEKRGAVPKQRDCSNESRQTGSWLERKKYSKILPKFMLSSAGSSGGKPAA